MSANPHEIGDKDETKTQLASRALFSPLLITCRADMDRRSGNELIYSLFWLGVSEISY